MKDFDVWNVRKKEIDESAEIVFHEREIWWSSIGINVGDEQDGKNDFFERPVLIIKKFNNKLAWVLPMSTKKKEGVYYHPLAYSETSNIVLLSQLRVISSKRFRRYVRKLSRGEFKKIKEKLIGLLR